MSDPHWPVFILSLEDAEERRAPLLQQLRQFGLGATVRVGVDARKGLEQGWEESVDRAAAGTALGRPISNGELGCALSHREIYRDILDQNLPGAIVLEDDAILTPHFKALFDTRRYQDCALLMMYHSHARVWGNPVGCSGEVSLRKLSMSASGTVAYCLSAHTAKTLLRAASPISYVADWPVELAKINACATVPRVVNHPELAADQSFIRQDRSLAQGRRQKSDPFRFWSGAFWKRWCIKRLSRRVS